MPSNAMKITQMIAQLQHELATHGDLDCVLSASEEGMALALDGRNINAALELPYARLPKPCLVFGIVKTGSQLLASAGHPYQMTDDGDDGWTYDRNLAPVDVDLIVWRRHAGKCKGIRTFDGWFIYDGAQRIEIVPAGILAWMLT